MDRSAWPWPQRSPGRQSHLRVARRGAGESRGMLPASGAERGRWAAADAVQMLREQEEPPGAAGATAAGEAPARAAGRAGGLRQRARAGSGGGRRERRCAARSGAPTATGTG